MPAVFDNLGCFYYYVQSCLVCFFHEKEGKGDFIL